MLDASQNLSEQKGRLLFWGYGGLQPVSFGADSKILLFADFSHFIHSFWPLWSWMHVPNKRLYERIGAFYTLANSNVLLFIEKVTALHIAAALLLFFASNASDWAKEKKNERREMTYVLCSYFFGSAAVVAVLKLGLLMMVKPSSLSAVAATEAPSLPYALCLCMCMHSKRVK